MKRIRLTKYERAIEDALVKGEYAPVKEGYLEEIAQAIEHRKKDAVLNIRINSDDLKHLRQRARRLGVKYQTFISEILHHVART